MMLTLILVFFLWKHIKIAQYIPSLLSFIINRNTYDWGELGFSTLQFVILFASCLTLVFASILETKSSTD
ncbi:hypothetical protein SAMN04488156_101507 [Bacillus sp. 166amftsu]|nr:hypothetical protein SAMN04488156_101507 [Bacillus sp. 166amftsu]